MSRELRRRLPMAAVVIAVLAAILSGTPVAAGAPVPGPSRGDVYIRDQASDFGFEPFNGTVWSSPDIKVCAVAAPLCAPVKPIAGGTYYVVVTLNNPGPGGSGTVTGNLRLYYTAQGGAANWPADWIPIGTVFGVSAPAGQTTVILPWVVPGPGHFCLLARWESNQDPMTFAEGGNTVTNTKNNNNIAWRNVSVVGLDFLKLPKLVEPFTIRDPGPETLITDLVITQPDRAFVEGNRLIVDLGPTLAARWKAAGSPGVGVRQVGETQVEIVDPREARIQNLPLGPQEDQLTRLLFMAGSAGGGRYVVNVWQTDNGGADIGGTRFDVTVG
jgi:hypothetical protein